MVLAKLISTIIGSRLGHWKQLPGHNTDWPSQGTESPTTIGKLVLTWEPQKLKPELLIPTLHESYQQNECLRHQLWHHLTPSDPGNINHSHNLSCKGVWKHSFYLSWRRWGHMLKEANPHSTRHRRHLVKCITFRWHWQAPEDKRHVSFILLPGLFHHLTVITQWISTHWTTRDMYIAFCVVVKLRLELQNQESWWWQARMQYPTNMY